MNLMNEFFPKKYLSFALKGLIIPNDACAILINPIIVYGSVCAWGRGKFNPTPQKIPITTKLLTSNLACIITNTLSFVS